MPGPWALIKTFLRLVPNYSESGDHSGILVRSHKASSCNIEEETFRVWICFIGLIVYFDCPNTCSAIHTTYN